METMHAAGRRTLPPVPRSGATLAPAEPDDTPSDGAGRSPADIPTQRFVVDSTATGQLRVPTPSRHLPGHGDTEEAHRAGPDAQGATAPSGGAASSLDPAQEFVERLRAASSDFAEAARAASAVVREAVPPARHRRARCRVVLRFADDTEADLTFLGPTGSPGTPSRHGFDRQIRRWLGSGLRRESAWLVPDAEASGGMAVDLTAWLAAS